MTDAWIDELERDLGSAPAMRLLIIAGGQRREIPRRANGSKLAGEVGADVVAWLSDRFGGMALDIPSLRGRERQDAGSQLLAAVIEAGLMYPTRSANEIAREYGVTTAWVHKLRAQLRKEAPDSRQMLLPLFDDRPARRG